MTTSHAAATAAGTVPAARTAPDARPAAACPAGRSRWAPRPASTWAWRARTSRSPPPSPTASPCACSMRQAPKPRSRCRTTTPMSGMPSCRESARASPTGTGSTAPGTRPRGLRCNPAKLLLDPYAKAVSGTVSFGPEVLGQDAADPGKRSTLDSAGHMPRSLVVDPAFGWQDDERPWHRYADTVLYEVHVKGFTMRHPDIPPPLRGTYAGLGHEAAIAHLLDLGVTTVELLPGAPERAGVVPGRAGADELLGLQHDRLLRAAQRLLRRRPGRPARRAGRRVQGDGGRAAPGRPGSDPRRGVQPHRRSRAGRPRRCASAASTTWPTTGSSPATPACTTTPPAAATR